MAGWAWRWSFYKIRPRQGPPAHTIYDVIPSSPLPLLAQLTLAYPYGAVAGSEWVLVNVLRWRAGPGDGAFTRSVPG